MVGWKFLLFLAEILFTHSTFIFMPSNFSHKLTVIFILLTLGQAEAQRCVPLMWVPLGYSQARTTQFSSGTFASPSAQSKEDILNSIIKGTHPLNYTYPIATYTQLVNKLIADDITFKHAGIRLHFAAYDPTHPAPKRIVMTGVMDKQLLLIFSASDTSAGTKEQNFYFIGPNDGVVYTLPDTTVTAWVQHYVDWDDTPNGLVTTVDHNDNGNRVPPGQAAVYTDTWSIYYDSLSFKDFLITERDYQIGMGRNIDHIAMEFAAYTNQGNYLGGFKGRMIILYEFILNNSIFYIDTTSEFPQRYDNPACPKPLDYWRKHGGDNGQLCPPNCPCTPIPCN
jgi:hypothetical protein